MSDKEPPQVIDIETGSRRYLRGSDTSEATPSSNGGGGGGDDMERRVARLEAWAGHSEERLARIESKLESLGTTVQTISENVSEIKGKISQLPSTFTVLSSFVGVALASMIGVATLVYLVAS